MVVGQGVAGVAGKVGQGRAGQGRYKGQPLSLRRRAREGSSAHTEQLPQQQLSAGCAKRGVGSARRRSKGPRGAAVRCTDDARSASTMPCRERAGGRAAQQRTVAAVDGGQAVSSSVLGGQEGTVANGERSRVARLHVRLERWRGSGQRLTLVVVETQRQRRRRRRQQRLRLRVQRQDAAGQRQRQRERYWGIRDSSKPAASHMQLHTYTSDSAAWITASLLVFSALNWCDSGESLSYRQPALESFQNVTLAARSSPPTVHSRLCPLDRPCSHCLHPPAIACLLGPAPARPPSDAAI